MCIFFGKTLLFLDLESMNNETTQRIFQKYKDIIAEEVNVEEVYILPDTHQTQKVYVPIGKEITQYFGKDTGNIISAAKKWAVEHLGNGHIRVFGDNRSWDLWPTMYEIRYEWLDPKTQAATDTVVIQMDFVLTPELIAKWRARDISRTLNQLRKDAQASIDARLAVYYTDMTWDIAQIIESHKEFLKQEALLHTIEPREASHGDLDLGAIMAQTLYEGDEECHVHFVLTA
jgi:hypothetical protein